MWERACSRKGHHFQHQCRLINRFREQARSHKKPHGANGAGINRRQAGTMPTPFLLRPCHD
ncbi:hypothetical protein EAH78_04935 [Pseudomonas arsenicoxydans]|uniref:Uncharacterized protein n=1 Tax=Pseudomonas arsenicoxydans TaxID=702115 RepID=A0A502I3B8_9PSED|nr:hypothetical protein EAH78_04935 [Pseudomonas arsenicoxydans]